MQRRDRLPSQSRQERAALLKAIAQKRNSKRTGSTPHTSLLSQPQTGSVAYDSLEDSSEVEELADKEEVSQDERDIMARRPAFRRLRKHVMASEIDSIADSMGALDVNLERQTSLAPAAEKTPSSAQGSDEPARSQGATSSPQNSPAEEDTEGLFLGDNGKFKLDPDVNRGLYAHQV